MVLLTILGEISLKLLSSVTYEFCETSPGIFSSPSWKVSPAKSILFTGLIVGLGVLLVCPAESIETNCFLITMYFLFLAGSRGAVMIIF